MKLTREVRKTTAQFLNGVAVAVLVAGAIGPKAMGMFNWAQTTPVIIVSLAMHGLALAIVGWRS
jgi:predicted Fe-Mo cluster-binding NifX family protein